MKWLSRLALGLGVLSLLLLAGYSQFGRGVDEARADVAASPWPTSATTGTHLMVITITTSSTWVAPDGVTNVIVELWGAGGAARPTISDGCGGGGAYARSNVSVTPGNAYWIQVGHLSSAATTTFATTTVVAAPGWSWTNGGAGGQVSSSTGDVVFNGSPGLAASNSRGASAGDREGSTGAAPNGLSSNGAPPGSSTNLVQAIPGGSACDAGDPGGRGLARLTYSSTTLSGFPYVRQRHWDNVPLSFNPIIRVPTTTQPGDVILALVAYGTQNSTPDVPGPACLTNCTGVSKVFSSSTTFGGVTLFKKEATSSFGNDFTVSTTWFGTNPFQSYYTLSIANADIDDISFATSSAPTASYGDPPSLNTGVAKKYLWLYGSISGGQTNDVPFCPDLGTTGTMILTGAVKTIGKSHVWWESFQETSTLDPIAVPSMSTILCTGTANRDWLAYTIAIAGLAADEEEGVTTAETTPQGAWGGGFSAGLIHW